MHNVSVLWIAFGFGFWVGGWAPFWVELTRVWVDWFSSVDWHGLGLQGLLWVRFADS